MAQTELWIDRTKCDGSRLCAELFPERISLDDWGYPIISPGPIPGSLMPHAQKAVDSCPVLALALRKVERRPPHPPVAKRRGANRARQWPWPTAVLWAARCE